MNWDNVSSNAPELIIRYGANIILALAIFFIGKWLAQKAIFWVSQTMGKRGVDSTVSGFIANIAYIVALVLLAVAAMSQLGIPTTSFIALIGAAGLAIGLALQGSLSNFASGVLLVTLKPCKAGDYIETSGLGGSVKQITIFSTTLETPDKRTIIIPNALLFSSPITNYTTASARRLDMVISISYDADISLAKSLLLSTVEQDPRILADNPIQIGVLALAESSVDIAVRPWVNTDDYWPVHFDLHERIKLALDEANIEIPFPQRAVHLQPANHKQV